MKLILLQLLVCIYSLFYGQWADWQEIGKTACGPVLIKLGELPDSTVSGEYQVKIIGTPDADCEVLVRSYFMTTDGKKVSDEVTLNSALEWKQSGAVTADSLIGYMHSEIVSSTGCSCQNETESSGTDTAILKPITALLQQAADSVAADKAAAVAKPSVAAAAEGAVAALPLPDTAAAESMEVTNINITETPILTEPKAGVAEVQESPAAAKPLAAATPEIEKPSASGAAPDNHTNRAVTANNDTAAFAAAWAEIPGQPAVAAEAELPRAKPKTKKAVKKAFSGNWGIAIANWGVAPDSALLGYDHVNLAEDKEGRAALKLMTREELDSIRIYNDPVILDRLSTVAHAYMKIDEDRAIRNVVPTARERLDLLEEKQQLFMEKYTQLIKTGDYSLRPCSACFGNPIIHHLDSYPPYEACDECKGGGYQLTYHGKAKPKTIEHLYFAELLPAPDYRKPTLKRVAENPADFEYDNGVFKTNLEKLSARKGPFFFVCMYFRGDENKQNRLLITEIINKREHHQFIGASKDSVMHYLDPHLGSKSKHPDEMYFWEFNTYDDAYDRSIIPLHRAGVVGFHVDIVKFE